MARLPLQAVRSVFAECLLFKTVDVGVSIDNPDIVLPRDVARCGIAVYCFIRKKCMRRLCMMTLSLMILGV